jgi:hypothetical protein
MTVVTGCPKYVYLLSVRQTMQGTNIMLVELYFEEGVRFFKISHNAIKMIVIMFLIPLCTAAHKKK